MIILYYSTKTVFPAVLASINHCHPAIRAEQAWDRAAEWLRKNYRPAEPPFFLKYFGPSPGGNALYLMATGVPPTVIRQTLNSLTGLIGGCHGAPQILPAGPLPQPAGRWRRAPGGRKIAYWKEIGVFVEQTRLRMELIKQQ